MTDSGWFEIADPRSSLSMRLEGWEHYPGQFINVRLNARDPNGSWEILVPGALDATDLELFRDVVGQWVGAPLAQQRALGFTDPFFLFKAVAAGEREVEIEFHLYWYEHFEHRGTPGVVTVTVSRERLADMVAWLEEQIRDYPAPPASPLCSECRA